MLWARLFSLEKSGEGHLVNSLLAGLCLGAFHAFDSVLAGWLLNFVHDLDTDTSNFVVLDAQSLDEVARVPLPRRVPVGFHGAWFVDED